LIALALVASLSACTVATPPPHPQGTAARIDHVAIHVANAEASAGFYKAVFGFAELKNPFPGGGGVVWLDLGNGVALHIFGNRPADIANEHERHLAFTVADMAKVTDTLRSRGIAWRDFDGVAGQVQTRPDGVRQLFFRDPDGYWIEVNDALKNAR
jgi:lactoylglutathione lyase